MRFVPSRQMLAQSWQKYGLIVVGNIVFFVLLYFISYRPNNDEHRAAELLAMAQEQEAGGRFEAAAVLLQKVLARYPDTEAARTATARLPAVRKRQLARAAGTAPEVVPPVLDLAEMLDRKPSIYVATYLASHYGDDPALKPKLRPVIAAYLGQALRVDGATLAALKREKELRDPELAQELFAIKPACAMTPDLIYDDFAVRNDNFFPWTGANLKLEVRQGSERVVEERRVETVAPGAEIDVLEFDVDGSGGVVSCAVEVTAAEGQGSWSGKI